jgi:uncharacterized delta-60 repeat protein
VRLNADGSLDTRFNTNGLGFDAAMHALALESDGQVLAGGDFTDYNGLDVPNYLVRLNVNGLPDADFNATGPVLNGTVLTLAVEPDGQVLAGGSFDQVGPVYVGRLVRFNADGSRDAGFNAGGNGFNAFIRALVLEPDGQVLVGGDFLEYNGANVPDRLVRLNANGSVDASFNAGGSGFSSSVYALALEPDGQVLAGGDFTTYNGATGSAFVQRLNANGSPDLGFNAGGTGFGYPGNQPIVLALCWSLTGR